LLLRQLAENKKQMIDRSFRPVRDEKITTCQFSINIKSLTGLKELNLNRALKMGFYNNSPEQILPQSGNMFLEMECNSD